MFMQKLEHTFAFGKQPFPSCGGRWQKRLKNPAVWAFFQGGELYEVLWFYTRGLQKIQESPGESILKTDKHTEIFHFRGGRRLSPFRF